ncbi:MAG: cytochrome c biogenesis CcdA family protein [Rhodocyclaceae bacterium]
MTDASTVGFATAFLAGTVSFLSPCVLPLVPGYVSYIAGHSVHGVVREDAPARARLAALVLSLFFVLGFSTVFIAFGAATSALGQLLIRYRQEVNLIGGAIVVGFGLFMLGLVRHAWWFHGDWRFHPRIAGGHPAAAYVLGVAFAFGWTPCIGPVLGTILTLSATSAQAGAGVPLLAAYAGGLGVPFLASAFFTGALIRNLKRLRYLGRPLQILAGVLMVVMGIAMLTGQLSGFSYWLLQAMPVLGTIG